MNVLLLDAMIQEAALLESPENRAAMAVQDIKRAVGTLFDMSHDASNRDILIRELKDIQEAALDLIEVRQRIETRDMAQAAE